MTGIVGSKKNTIMIKADPEFNKMVEDLQRQIMMKKGKALSKRDVTFLLARGFQSKKFVLSFDEKQIDDGKKKRNTNSGLV